MTAPSIKEALELARTYIQEELDQDSPWSTTEGNAAMKAIDAALATLSPPAGERREAIARIIDRLIESGELPENLTNDDAGLSRVEYVDLIVKVNNAVTCIRNDIFDRAIRALEELTAVVRGECPSLLNEDSGGDGELDIEIDEVLEVAALASGLVQDEAGWMPISTAPKDHFPVLTWSEQGGRCVAFLDATWTWWPCPATDPLSNKPTHWMPLPAQPIRSARDGGAET